MIEVSEVLTCLLKYSDVDENFSGLEDCCERGLEWVYSRLRGNVKKTEPLIAHTAAAVAHYFYFLAKLTETDKYESYTAGDMTVRRNINKEILCESRIRDEAIIAARDILEDGGFYCCGA